MESCTLSRRSIIFLTVFCDCPSPEQLYYFYFQYHDLFNVKMRIIIFLIYMSLNGQNYKDFLNYLAKMKENFIDCYIFV